MRIGFDLDGTVADLHSALSIEARALFPDIEPDRVPSSTPSTEDPVDPDAAQPAGAGPPSAQPASAGVLSSRQQRQLWARVCARENFWETLDEMCPGQLARLFRLAQDRKWEIMFLTSRPETEGDTAQLQSHRWLAAHGFALPSVFVVHGSRGKIASALRLDVVVDDRPENCLDVAIDSSARAILVCGDDEHALPGSARQLGIGAVKSIQECLDVLEQLDDASAADGTGLVERLKRLLGLKPRTPRATQADASTVGVRRSAEAPEPR